MRSAARIVRCLRNGPSSRNSRSFLRVSGVEGVKLETTSAAISGRTTERGDGQQTAEAGTRASCQSAGDHEPVINSMKGTIDKLLADL